MTGNTLKLNSPLSLSWQLCNGCEYVHFFSLLDLETGLKSMKTFPANSLEGKVGELFPRPLRIACRSVREQSPFGIICICILFSIKASALCFKYMPVLWD